MNYYVRIHINVHKVSAKMNPCKILPHVFSKSFFYIVNVLWLYSQQRFLLKYLSINKKYPTTQLCVHFKKNCLETSAGRYAQL